MKSIRLAKCPVCNADIPLDYGMAMEIWDKCPNDSLHYQYFCSFFAHRVTLSGRRFNFNNPDELSEWADRVKRRDFDV